MRASKFTRIDPNILLEYIYDDGNLISESYSIVYNTNNGVYSFLSSLPETKNYLSSKTVLVNNVKTTKSFTNQLIELNRSQGQYGRLDFSAYSFIQKKDYGISIPIRYDKLRIWMPVNYLFDSNKGFYIRVYSLDFDEQKFVDLSNYFFNISDVNQSGEIDYASPPIYQGEMSWGKYIEVQFPSVTKVSDQRKLNVTREDTINYNLTEGKGLSKTAPVFIDFSFINSVQIVNNNTYYNVSAKRTIVVPQTPEFEKFGVVVEPSSQGDFFLIYPIYNGSIGEFNVFMEESFVAGNRYYLDYTIDIYEKNIKTKSQRIIVTEDFIEEIEFRPIFKYSTTTAIIEVTCKLIDAVDTSEVVRKASYGLLQDQVSNYSKYLSKIDLTKAEKVEVYKLKGIMSPNLDINSANTVKSSLKVNPIKYTIFSKSYDIVSDNTSINWKNKIYLCNRQVQIVIFPFDNVCQFNILKTDPLISYTNFDLSGFNSVEMVIRNDKKSINFDIFREVEQNLELGFISFKISEDKYSEIKKIYLSGFNTFYIVGNTQGIKSIIYTGLFLPWDVQTNISLLETNFTNVLSLPKVKKEPLNNTSEQQTIEDVKVLIENNQNVQTSTNTTEIQNVDKDVLGQIADKDKLLKDIMDKILSVWNPIWMGDFNIMIRAYDYHFESNTTNSTNKYQIPVNLRAFAIALKDKGIITDVISNKNNGLLSAATQAEVDLILGYFKIYNFNPLDVSIQDYIANNLQDLKNYLKSSPRPQSQVLAGSNVPPKNAYDLIKTYQITKLQYDVNPNVKDVSEDKPIVPEVVIPNNNNNNQLPNTGNNQSPPDIIEPKLPELKYPIKGKKPIAPLKDPIKDLNGRGKTNFE